MDRLSGLKLEMVSAIRDSAEYKEFKRCEAFLNRYPDIKRAVDDFRRENFVYQNSSDVVDPMNEAISLNERFTQIRNLDMVNRYLASEMAVCRMVKDLCMTAVSAVDFDMSFLK